MTNTNTDSRVTIHMAASLDGFIARKDGRTDWMEVSDEFAGGDTMAPEFVEAFLKTIDCYVMGSRTYETALNLDAKGFGWAYGDTDRHRVSYSYRSDSMGSIRAARNAGQRPLNKPITIRMLVATTATFADNKR
jgi:hypothetical protein